MFKVTLQSFKRAPELTDDWAAKNTDCKTAEDYKKEIRKTLEEEAKTSAQNTLRETAWNTVLSASEVKEYPQDDLDTAKTEFKTLYENYAKQGDMTLEDFVKAQGISMDDFEEQSSQYAEYKVKQNLIVQGIMDAENMTLEDEKSLGIQNELIKSYNVKDIAALVDKYGQAAVDESIGLLRVEDFIIDNATVEEKVTAGDTQGVDGDDPSVDGSSAEELLTKSWKRQKRQIWFLRKNRQKRQTAHQMHQQNNKKSHALCDAYKKCGARENFREPLF